MWRCSTAPVRMGHVEHLLSNGQRITLPDHDTFYRLLTESSSNLISRSARELLRSSGIVVAGCGAVGANVAEGLVRAGAEWLVLADPRRCDYSHINRMPVDLTALDRNRAELMAQRITDINPYATVTSMTAGITRETVEHLVRDSDLIIDALGMQSIDDLRTRYLLHTTAKQHRVPVVSGIDVACSGWVLVYDYRDPDQQVLDGSLNEAYLDATEEIDQIQVLTRMISLSKVPIETVREAERILRGQTNELPRLGYAAQFSSALVCQVVLDVLFGRPVRRVISLDLAGAVRPSRTGLRLAGRRLVELYSLRRHLRSRRRWGRVGVFSPLDDDVFKGLRQYMEERTYEAGSVIIRQGDPADEFFVVLSGSVQVEHEELLEPDDTSGEATRQYTVIAELGAGDYFGEMALLTNTKRAASVVVTERCRVLALSHGAFELYLEESIAAALRVREVALNRQRDNHYRLGV